MGNVWIVVPRATMVLELLASSVLLIVLNVRMEVLALFARIVNIYHLVVPLKVVPVISIS